MPLYIIRPDGNELSGHARVVRAFSEEVARRLYAVEMGLMPKDVFNIMRYSCHILNFDLGYEDETDVGTVIAEKDGPGNVRRDAIIAEAVARAEAAREAARSGADVVPDGMVRDLEMGPDGKLTGRSRLRPKTTEKDFVHPSNGYSFDGSSKVGGNDNGFL